MPDDAIDIRLRPVRPDDATAVRDIYAPFVRDSPATFRTEVPSVASVEADIRETLAAEEYPWYVAVQGVGGDGHDRRGDEADDVVGYAYGSQLRKRPAYRWAVETSIYVDPDAHRAGIGSRLYDRLLETLREQGYCAVFAALGMPNPESEAFHERRGFERVGRFPAAGFKLGEWHDVVWYHRRLREPAGEPAEPRPVSAVDGAFGECD
ncbi:GNAT family N-acetyltransferase [Halobellus sp. GM3]|uniref:GNAT family N-acetyltransferase n=1 Tax=Halobellus sp. GM3 TaxID=3458410 RepID=UPI00403E0FC1